MSKSNKKKDEVIQDERDLVITSCILKDSKPTYSFRKLTYPGKGDIDNVKGAAVVHADMLKAFKKLNVHMACIDDAFKSADITFESISKVNTHDLTSNYTVTGFKIKGKDEDEKISLVGKKYVSVGGYEEIETPEVLLASFSAYKWWNELNTAIDKCRQEVEAYRDGKCTPDEEEEIENPDQTKLHFEHPLESNGIDELEKAKVQ